MLRPMLRPWCTSSVSCAHLFVPCRVYRCVCLSYTHDVPWPERLWLSRGRQGQTGGQEGEALTTAKSIRTQRRANAAIGQCECRERARGAWRPREQRRRDAPP